MEFLVRKANINIKNISTFIKESDEDRHVIILIDILEGI
jgi:hypothetical protein